MLKLGDGPLSHPSQCLRVLHVLLLIPTSFTSSDIFRSYWGLLVLFLGCSLTSSGLGTVSSSIPSLQLLWIWSHTEPGNYRVAVPHSDGKEAQHFLASLGHWFLDHPGTLQYELCYKFILIFKGRDCQNNVLFQLLLVCSTRLCNWCTRVAESWEFGHLLTVTSWAWAPKGRVAWNGRTALEAVSLVQ